MQDRYQPASIERLKNTALEKLSFGWVYDKEEISSLFFMFVSGCALGHFSCVTFELHTLAMFKG